MQMPKEWTVVDPKTVNILIFWGGCPANNSKCTYLQKGVCQCVRPHIHTNGERYICGSAFFIVDEEETK